MRLLTQKSNSKTSQVLHENWLKANYSKNKYKRDHILKSAEYKFW